jgi:hypothetical protein
MWMGSPELTRSVAKILRKSWAENVVPTNSGWVLASSVQHLRRRRQIVLVLIACRSRPVWVWNR